MCWEGKWGAQSDASTGLYYLGNRYYDYKIGRFISRDPIGFAGGINLYVYCGNDPVDYVDTDGLDGYWQQVGEVWEGYGDALNPANMVRGLGAAGSYLYQNEFSDAAFINLGRRMLHGMEFWNADSPRAWGASFMGDLLIAAPVIKKIPELPGSTRVHLCERYSR